VHVVQAEDHCRGLADLIRTRRSFACDAVARSLAENSVRAWFLLEPDIDAAERVRRQLNERLWATHEHAQWIAKLADHQPAAAQLAIQQRDRLTKQCEEAGYQVAGAGRKRDVPHIGEPRPGLASLLERTLRQPGVTEDISGYGAAFYAQLSAVAHGGMHGFVQRLELVLDAGGPARGMVHELAPGEIVAAFAIAPLVFCVVATLCAEQLGWPTEGILGARRTWIRAWSLAAG
jgi:hypothetical protein